MTMSSIGGGDGGGTTVSSASRLGGSSAMAGRTADAGEIIAGRDAAGGSTGTACWLQTAYASRTADLLLVLNRSESMNNDLAEDCVCSGTVTGSRSCSKAGCKDRWSTVAAAISTAISATPNIHSDRRSPIWRPSPWWLGPGTITRPHSPTS